jgi:hypothetical protein
MFDNGCDLYSMGMRLLFCLILASCSTIPIGKKEPIRSICYTEPKYKVNDCFQENISKAVRCILTMENCEYVYSVCMEGWGCIIERQPYAEFEDDNITQYEDNSWNLKE